MIGGVCTTITTRHSLPSTEMSTVTPLPTVLKKDTGHGGTGIVQPLISTATMPLQVPSHHTFSDWEASLTSTLMIHAL